MSGNTQLTSVFIVVAIALFFSAALQAADAPAGQVCPSGSFVIGFDSNSNILCSASCGNRVLNDGETCDDGNLISGDGCSATCQSEPSPAAMQQQAFEEPPPAGAPPPAEAPPSGPVSNVESPVTAPVVSKIKPGTAVFGVREVTIAISGNGFTNGTTVLFKGSRYTPSVNQSGTELRVTLPARELPMGYHAITVSNGPGMETTIKRAIEVF